MPVALRHKNQFGILCILLNGFPKLLYIHLRRLSIIFPDIVLKVLVIVEPAVITVSYDKISIGLNDMRIHQRILFLRDKRLFQVFHIKSHNQKLACPATAHRILCLASQQEHFFSVREQTGGHLYLSVQKTLKFICTVRFQRFSVDGFIVSRSCIKAHIQSVADACIETHLFQHLLIIDDAVRRGTLEDSFDLRSTQVNDRGILLF